jgi:hypothetical protein
MNELAPGESVNLSSRVDGGLVATRDANADDVIVFERSYESLSAAEVAQLAEALGVEVVGDE